MCLPAWSWYEILILWSRCSHEDAAWSKLIQECNTLQSQVLPGLQKASSSPEFSEAIEHVPEREKQLNERCRNFPLQSTLYAHLSGRY